ncbi:MAG: ATP-binding protein [Smithellaceae bacterium]|nr:ATP-binding protein [Smithellaceae bacterium]
MNSGKKLVWQDDSGSYKGRFLQPLVVGLVCGVIIVLFIVMGIMDLRRSENTLRGFMEDQGLSLIGILERLAQENLNTLIKAHQRGEVDTYAPRGDEAFSPHKWLTHALAGLGREIDGKWMADDLSETYLRKFAAEKNLWLIAVANKQGNVVFQSRSLPARIGDNGRQLPANELSKDLIERLSAEKKIGFLALKRKDGSGTVIIALDNDGLRYWSVKVAVEKALEKFGEAQGQGQGLSYIVLRDGREVLLGRTGVIPVPWKKDELDRELLLAGKKKILSRTVLYQGKKVLDIGAPLSLSGQIAGTVRLGMEMGSTEAVLQENMRSLFISLSFVVAVALLSMWFLYRTQNRHLAGIVEMERRLEKAERLSALGQLAAGVAHEIRNPLNAISMASQRMKREFMPSEEDKQREFGMFTGIIRDEIRRLNGIIEEFLSFSRSRRLELHNYSLVEVLQKIVNLIREEAVSQGIQITTVWDSQTVTIPMDMDKLQQAFLNFLKNAMESIEGGGSIEVRVTPNRKGHVTVSITDTGCGMAPEEVEQIFSPDYTTKEKGLGLGLALAHEIIRGHGGEIRVFSQPGVGTQFDVILPSKEDLRG